MTTNGEMGYNGRMIRSNPLAFVAALACAVAAVSCSSSSDSPSGGGTDSGSDTGTGGIEVLVGSGGTVFTPSTLTIKVGQTVTWKWAGSGHSVTEADGDPATCTVKAGGFDSTIQATGQTFSHTFSTAGTVNYFCQPHCASGMRGQIIVTP